MGKMQRDKGARFERFVAMIFKAVYPNDLVRRSRQAEGALESDVVTPYFWVECGHGKRMNAQHKLSQAISDCNKAGSDKVPVAVVKVDRGEPVVCMRLFDFIDMVEVVNERARARGEAQKDNGPAGQAGLQESGEPGAKPD